MRFQRPQSGWGRGGVLACALLVAALVLLLPAAALAAPDSLAPRTRGSILIRYSKDYASYDVYRLFDLAVSSEEDQTAQGGVAYTYVLRQTIATDTDTRENPWWTFLTTYGPDGAHSASPYAVLSSETSARKKAAALFVIDAQELTLNGEAGYHAVSAAEPYASMTDLVARSTTLTAEAAGEPASAAQSFTKAALAFAGRERLDWRLGHYVARGRETYGNEAGQANADSVYQYSGDTAYVTNIPLGTYLLDVNEGALCSMDIDSTSALAYDRKEYPELFVQVRAKNAPIMPSTFGELDSDEQHDLVWSEDSLMRWAYRTDVNLGAVVQFKTVIIAQQGVTDYRLHEVMEKGLTFLDGTVDASYRPQVYLYCQAADATYEIPSSVGTKTNWVLHTPDEGKGALADRCDFEVEFRDVAQGNAASDVRTDGDTGDAAGADERVDAGTSDGSGDGGGSGDDAREEQLTFAREERDASGSASVVMQDVADWDRIVITYWARLNDRAVVYGSDKQAKTVKRAKDLSKVKGGADGSGERLLVQTHTATDGNNRNTNSAVLTYGDDSHTTWARAEVASYQFDVVRASAPASSDLATGAYPLLAGAEFALYRTADEAADGAVAYTAEVNMAQKAYYYVPDQPLLFTQDGSVYTYASGNGAAAASRVAQVASDETGVSVDVGSANNEALTSKVSAGQVASGGEAPLTGEGSPTEDASPTTATSPSATAPLTSTLISSSDSVIRVRGLEAGVYLLAETKAPIGSTATRPSIVTIHSRAYYNNDPVEDSTPGLRHTNTEGNITVTTFSEGRYSTTNVVGWKAKVNGSPATYEKARPVTTTGGQEVLSNGKSASVANGGVLVAERGDIGVRADDGINPLVLCVVGFAIAGAGAVMWTRRGVINVPQR